jgi:hypothetical protein
VVRIVKAPRSDNFNKKLATPHFGQIKSGSFHDPEELTRRTTKKRSIRRVMVPFQGEQGGPGVAYKTIGGNTNWMSSPAAESLTNNPNPKFDPSQAPGAVTKKIRTLATVKGTSGHGGTVENYTGNASYRGMKINKR